MKEEARCMVCGAMIGLSFIECAMERIEVCSDECAAIYYENKEEEEEEE